ncbi:MAG: hypothetical protein KJO33_06830 [Gammaproteobacteria bacterium]|nr:hypothetical protein [Gammaproteobacteria bacterium]
MGAAFKIVLTAALMAFGTSCRSAEHDVPPGTSGGAVPVEVVRDEEGWTLLRGGQPYVIKGAGTNGRNLVKLAASGGNSFRNWRDFDSPDGMPVLDEALELGLTVAMCLPIGRERHGFDYDDPEAVRRQFEFVRQEVLRYKDHPALLLWIIGNEPDLNYSNPKVFDAINDISKMIHEVDGRHPTTTALSFSFKPELVDHVKKRMPDLDMISVQKYADIVNLPRYIDQAGIDLPYLVTEYGPVGHWEVEKTAWGAPIEPTSSEKAAHYRKNFEAVIEANPDRILGSYAFLWGQKQERTPTWYGMFLEDGSVTEAVDAMHFAWSGAWPDNRSPRMEGFYLDARPVEAGIELEPGERYPARAVASDPDGDPLTYRWALRRESDATQVGGDREEIPEKIPGLIEAADDGHAVLSAPEQAGDYRLFVYVYDGNGHAGHANIPFRVR